MCYNCVLLIACCFYAYKARNVPGNFNEARFYVASVYTTILPIVAALPMYFTAERAIIVVVSITLVLIINGYVTLACVYLPKLYAITFKKFDDQEVNMADQSRTGIGNTIQCRRPFVLSGSSGSDNKVHPSAT